MPTYEYHCDECGKDETVWKSISQYRAPESCTCGKIMRRVFSSVRCIVDLKDKNAEAIMRGDY